MYAALVTQQLMLICISRQLTQHVLNNTFALIVSHYVLLQKDTLKVYSCCFSEISYKNATCHGSFCKEVLSQALLAFDNLFAVECFGLGYAMQLVWICSQRL